MQKIMRKHFYLLHAQQKIPVQLEIDFGIFFYNIFSPILKITMPYMKHSVSYNKANNAG